MRQNQKPSIAASQCTRRGFLQVACLGAAGVLLPRSLLAVETAQRQARRPSIVLIFADDLGYGDLGCYGNTEISTPHIDSIARDGVRFTDGYVTAPLCSPARAGLLTGRYQQRYGFETNPGPEQYAEEDFGLPTGEATLAERLKPLGYATGMVGKWHLGYERELAPSQRGFDEFFGFLAGAHSYFPSRRRSDLLRGNEPAEARGYLTDAFAQEAESFIDRHAQEPFFLYLPFNAVHSPLQASEKYLARFPGIADPAQRAFAAMLSALDDAVGTVLAALRRHGLEQDTLLFFISDNGGPTSQTTASNGPFNGAKGQLLEGGIRVPYIVRWPGHLPAGAVYRNPVSALDVVPTVLAAGGRAPDPTDALDGVNLTPFLTGSWNDVPHEALYWRFQRQQAIRQGDWKLVVQGRRAQPRLYNLADDIGETTDLADVRPVKVRELQDAWEAWSAQLEAPRWRRQDASTQRATQPTEWPQDRGVDARFRQMDRNGDGQLTRQEVRRAQLFDRLDVNRDGIVTLDEARRSTRRAR